MWILYSNTWNYCGEELYQSVNNSVTSIFVFLVGTNLNLSSINKFDINKFFENKMSGTLHYSSGCFCFKGINNLKRLCRESISWNTTAYTVVFAVCFLRWQKSRSLLYTNNICGLWECSDFKLIFWFKGQNHYRNQWNRFILYAVSLFYQIQFVIHQKK